MNSYKNRFEDIETVEDYYKFKAQNDPTLLNITNQSMNSFRGSQFLKQQDPNTSANHQDIRRPDNGELRNQSYSQYYNQNNQNQGNYRGQKNPASTATTGNNDWGQGNTDQHQSDFDFPVYKAKPEEKLEGSIYDMNRQSRLNDFSKIEPIPHVNDDTVEQSLMHFLTSKKKSPKNENMQSISSWNQGAGGRPNFNSKEDYYNNKIQGGAHNGNAYINNRADRVGDKNVQGNYYQNGRPNDDDSQYKQNCNGPSRYEGSVNARITGPNQGPSFKNDLSGPNVLVSDPKIRLLLNDVNSLIEKAEGKNFDRGNSNFLPGSEKNYGSGRGSNRGTSLVDKYTKGETSLERGDIGGRNYVENSSVRAYLKSLESKIDVAKTDDKKEVNKESSSTASTNKGNASNNQIVNGVQPNQKKETVQSVVKQEPTSQKNQKPSTSSDQSSDQSKGLSNGVEALKQRAKFPVKKKKSKKKKDLDVIADNNSSEENSSEQSSSSGEDGEEDDSLSDKSANRRRKDDKEKEKKKKEKEHDKKKKKQKGKKETEASSKRSHRRHNDKQANSTSDSETNAEDENSDNGSEDGEISESSSDGKSRQGKKKKSKRDHSKLRKKLSSDNDDIEFEEVQTIEEEDSREISNLKNEKRDKSKKSKEKSKKESKKDKRKKKDRNDESEEEDSREKKKRKKKDKKYSEKHKDNRLSDRSALSMKIKENDTSKLGLKQKGVVFIDEALTPITTKTGLMDLDDGIQGTSPFQIEDQRATNNQQRLSLKKSTSEISMFSGSVSTLFSNNKSFVNDMSCLKGLDKEKADQYLRKKYGPEAQQKIEAGNVSRSLKTIEGGEILCVDCEEYINIDEVDEHSKLCYKSLGKDKKENRLTVEEKFEAADCKTKLVITNEKLRKITELLRKKIGKMHLEDPVNAEPIFNYCTMLIRCTDQIIIRNTTEEITELVRNIKDVNIFNKRLYELHNKYSKMVLNLSLRIKQFAKLKIPLIDSDFTWEQAKEMTKLSSTMVLNIGGGANQSQMINHFKKNSRTGTDSCTDSILGMRPSEFLQDSEKKSNKSIVHTNASQTVNSKNNRNNDLNISQNANLNTSHLGNTSSIADHSKNMARIPRSPIVQRVAAANVEERIESANQGKNNSEAMENSQSLHNISSGSGSVKRFKIKNPQQNLLMRRETSSSSGLRLNQNMSNKINPIAGESKMNSTSTSSLLNESDISGIFKEVTIPGNMNINNGIGKMMGKENLFNFKKPACGDSSLDVSDPQIKNSSQVKYNQNDISINKSAAPNNATDMRRAQQDKKKKFFDLAVKIKLDLPQNHPARTVLVNDLYDRAVNERVVESNWVDYISKHYNSIKC